AAGSGGGRRGQDGGGGGGGWNLEEVFVSGIPAGWTLPAGAGRLPGGGGRQGRPSVRGGAWPARAGGKGARAGGRRPSRVRAAGGPLNRRWRSPFPSPGSRYNGDRTSLTTNEPLGKMSP